MEKLKTMFLIRWVSRSLRINDSQAGRELLDALYLELGDLITDKEIE